MEFGKSRKLRVLFLSVGLVFALLLFQTLASFILKLVANYAESGSEIAVQGLPFVKFLVNLGPLSLVIYLGLVWFGIGLRDIFSGPRLPGKLVLGLILVFSSWIFLSSLIASIVIHFFPVSDTFQTVMAEIILNQPWYVSLFYVGFFASVSEELLCRGIMAREMRNEGTARWAIFWSSFLFSFMHLNPWQGVPSFFTGVLLGWMYMKTGSIWVPMLGHFVNNATVLALVRLGAVSTGMVSPETTEALPAGATGWSYFIMLLVMGPLFLWGLDMVNRATATMPEPRWKSQAQYIQEILSQESEDPEQTDTSQSGEYGFPIIP